MDTLISKFSSRDDRNDALAALLEKGVTAQASDGYFLFLHVGEAERLYRFDEPSKRESAKARILNSSQAVETFSFEGSIIKAQRSSIESDLSSFLQAVKTRGGRMIDVGMDD